MVLRFQNHPSLHHISPLLKQQILDSSKPKELAEFDFKFDESSQNG